MSDNIIAIPFQIEALVLDNDKMVVGPLTDFKKLPFNNGKEDVNFSQPFVAEGMVHQPFCSEDFLLKKGIHLHFIIPHFIGQAIPSESKLNNAGALPAAPNRWLVTKTLHSNSSIIGQWIIESDYIHADDYDPNNSQKNDAPTAIIPNKGSKPFKYMGRKIDLLSSQSVNSNGTYFSTANGGKALTVVGYGDINFSSFYPNCLGVFGFWDADGVADGNTEYTVVGWNDSENDDLLYSYLNTYTTASNPNSKNNNADFIVQQFNNLFKLNLSGFATVGSQAPRSLFCGKITLDKNLNGPETVNTSKLTIGIGNTGTEAISAFVANNLSTDNKGVIEDQLEAIMLNSKLSNLLVDVGPKFLEARHDKGFRSSPSGHLWRIVTTSVHSNSSNSNSVNSANAANNANTNSNAIQPPAVGFPEEPVLDPKLAKLLHRLNLAQHNYDKSEQQIISLQRQLFLDWCKYMRAEYPPLEGRGQYPDSDHIRYFIENYSFVELENLNNLTGSLSYGDATSSFKPAASSTSLTALDSKVEQAWQEVNSVLIDANNNAGNNVPQLSLAMIAGPRYWEANAPAILISGLDDDESDGQINSSKSVNLISSSFQIPSFPYTSLNLGDLLVQVNCANIKLSDQKWKPFLLDWEIDFTKQSQFNNYASDSVSSNFNLDEFGPDLVPDVKLGNSISVFSGTVIMSPNGRAALQASLKLFIQNELKELGIVFSDTNIIDTYLPTATSLWTDFIAKIPTAQSADLTNDYTKNSLYTAWMAYQSVLDKNIITQALDGFNHACIMQRKTPQFPIDEPIGFEDSKLFTGSVKNLVENVLRASPITAFDFNPLRCGQVVINKLRLIDNFGLKLDVGNINPVVADTLSSTNGIYLKPRITQPARLNFRWVAASGETEGDAEFEDEVNYIETNDHPDTTPVCGWLVPNYFDNILAVYSGDGHAIGYIDNNLNWNVLPWVNMKANITANVANPYLLNVLQWIISDLQGKGLNQFLDNLKTSLNNISPAAKNLYNSKALLMGRPIAVVRSRLSFQVKGLPVINQSWSSLLSDLTNCDNNSQYDYQSRNNEDWTSIKLPLRLGEHWQLNDGLVGYWIEDGGGNLSNTFTAPELISEQTTVANGISAYSAGVYQTQWLAINDKPINVTMLCDPRGLVHATTGVLPTKAISIPPQHYLPALKNILMWFYTPSLLQPELVQKSKMYLNLPAVEENMWQYWNSKDGIMDIVADDPKQNLHGKFKLKDGWLCLGPNNKGLAIEIAEDNYEVVLQDSLNFYATTSQLPQKALAYVNKKDAEAKAGAAALQANINACMGMMQTVNTQVNNLDNYVCQDDDTFSLSAWLINVDTTSPVSDWNKFYNAPANANNNINNHFGYNQTGCDFSCITQSGVGISTTFNPSNPWSNIMFMNYVNKNFQTLCTSFNTYSPSGQTLYLNDDPTNNYVVPCQALYDYFWLMYNAQLNSPTNILMSIDSFTVDSWKGAIAYVSTTESFNQLVYQSAQGVNSTYNINNPFNDSNFVIYLTSNFNALCTKLPVGCLIAYNNNNYIIPCQSLYDYLYANYQISLTSNN